MFARPLLCLVSLLAFISVECAPASDEVTTLPGWSGPLQSRVYSGHIYAGKDSQDGVEYTFYYWYMFIEMANVSDPTTAPLVLFSNGGPGASSAYGLFTEFGPYFLNFTSMATNPPTLYANPYAWTNLANVLILNGPAPVGYSYCEPAGPSGNGTGGAACGSWNDTRTLNRNVEFLLNWFKAFPEYSKCPFYIVGESYAGVYGGMLVQALLDGKYGLNLKGLALGDACMGLDVVCGPSNDGPWMDILFLAGHGCSSVATFESILSACPMAVLKFGPMSRAPAACQAAVSLFYKECPSNAYYAYNYEDQCPDDPLLGGEGGPPGAKAPKEPNGYPCGGGTASTEWITRPDVMAALHIAPGSHYFSADNGEGMVYNLTWASNLPLMRRLQIGADGVRVLVYNGDTDPSVTTVIAQNWTYSLNFPVKEPWRQWTFSENSTIVGGSIVRWEGGFDFVTIRGSGHMVPRFKPYSAYLMMQRWLNDEAWPALPVAGDYAHAGYLPRSPAHTGQWSSTQRV